MANGSVEKTIRVRGVFSFTVMLCLLVGMVVDLATGCKPFSKYLYVFFALLSLLISGWALNKSLHSRRRIRYELTQHWSFWVMVGGCFLVSVFLIFSPHHCPYR